MRMPKTERERSTPTRKPTRAENATLYLGAFSTHCAIRFSELRACSELKLGAFGTDARGA